MCVCMCVSVWGREGGRERMYVYLCMCKSVGGKEGGGDMMRGRVGG